MPRLKLFLAYKGTRFQGWQVQAQTGDRPARTVQGCLEEALARITGLSLRIHGSGRTDSGVHALAQVAHVDLPQNLDMDWRRALNSQLPNDLSVIRAEFTAPDFHSRYDAKSKIYSYSLWLSRAFVAPQRLHYVWPVGELDIPAMDQAATRLLGEHDFAAFQNTGTDVKTTTRTMLSITHDHSQALESMGMELVWYFQATGFLKQMARNIMGCLVAVGKGKLIPEAIPGLLRSRDRTQLPATAPAQGLTMVKVNYE